MRTRLLLIALIGLLGTVALVAQPGPPRGGRGGPPGGRPVDVAGSVDRLFTLDANKDGELTAAEINDERLTPLLERADADHNQKVTREELTTLLNQESAAIAANRGPGPGGPPMLNPDDLFNGPPSPPRPGQVLPPFEAERLNLTPEQQQKIDELQRDVDKRLREILTEEQHRLLSEPRRRPEPPGPRFF